MKKNVCVFCSSSNNIVQKYFEASRQLGELIIKHNCNLLYGGAKLGLMGEIARTVLNSGGHVTGVMPKILAIKEVAFFEISKMIITKDMHERKAKLQSLSDAFVVLPGGFGTFEEAFEVITHKQIGIHRKPIVFINTGNYFGNLIEQMKTIYKEGFAKEFDDEIFYVASDANDAMAYINNYSEKELPQKWY